MERKDELKIKSSDLFFMREQLQQQIAQTNNELKQIANELAELQKSEPPEQEKVDHGK